MTRTIISSLARIADFEKHPYDSLAIGEASWGTGDYVLAEIIRTPDEIYLVEDRVGDMVPARPGDFIIGAFGVRASTLENVGSWTEIVNGEMNAMTSAGLFGALTSESHFISKTASMKYVGHIFRNDKKLCMADFAIRSDPGTYSIPTILLVGTSMSSGKTITGKTACNILCQAGVNVIGAKLTGAGRYRDILGFQQAGASKIFDFVDAGMPSTVVPEEQYRAAIRPLLHHIDSLAPDVVIAETGASPLEPYNGTAAIDELDDNIACTILSASDPYAVVGFVDAFGLKPDLVTGPATNTTAAIDLVSRLSDIPSINIVEERSLPAFRDFLASKLGRPLAESQTTKIT